MSETVTSATATARSRASAYSSTLIDVAVAEVFVSDMALVSRTLLCEREISIRPRGGPLKLIPGGAPASTVCNPHQIQSALILDKIPDLVLSNEIELNNSM